MPYIKQLRRFQLDTMAIEDLESEIKSPGELNYVITRLIDNYHNSRGDYQSVNDVVGALEGAKLEFYRRVAAPYEDQKAMENGDVYHG